MNWNIDKRLYFAFDNIEDALIIEQKLKLIQSLYPKFKAMKFYVLCGFDREGRYDNEFYVRDVESIFKRIAILSRYGAMPYLMRFKRVYTSEYSSIYANLAAWINQPNFYSKITFALYCILNGMDRKLYKQYVSRHNQYLLDGHKKGKSWRDMELFSENNPDIAEKYFHILFAKGGI